MKKKLLVGSLLVFWGLMSKGWAAEKNFTPCHVTLENLITRISREEGVPRIILRAICLIESGMNPYALNVAGKSYAFKSQSEAALFLSRSLKQGIQNVDVGCMQVNWRWHGKKVGHPTLLLDAETCLRYGATLLRDLARQKGGWTQAILYYHSSDQEAQHRYLQKLKALLNKEKDLVL